VAGLLTAVNALTWRCAYPVSRLLTIVVNEAFHIRAGPHFTNEKGWVAGAQGDRKTDIPTKVSPGGVALFSRVPRSERTCLTSHGCHADLTSVF
jgi:hypothetical protein